MCSSARCQLLKRSACLKAGTVVGNAPSVSAASSKGRPGSGAESATALSLYSLEGLKSSLQESGRLTAVQISLV